MCKLLNKYFQVLSLQIPPSHLQPSFPFFSFSPHSPSGQNQLRSSFPPSVLPYLQVKTSDFSLQVLHLTKQHQWNLQLHCHTRV